VTHIGLHDDLPFQQHKALTTLNGSELASILMGNESLPYFKLKSRQKNILILQNIKTLKMTMA
jgi:hypothetical protein